MTANDFVYGWQRAADPATASNYSWYVELTGIVNAAGIIAGEMEPTELGVRAVDDYTLEVTLEDSIPYFPAMTTYATLFPAHRATIEAHGTEWTRPENIVGNGAYTLTEHVIGERHTRTKSDTYWDADNVIITETTGLVINDENQALTRYFDGEVDMVEPLPPGRFPELQDEYPEQAHSIPRLCSYYYALNQSEGGLEQLKDPNVRKALSLAVDRGVIVDQILQGGQRRCLLLRPLGDRGLRDARDRVRGHDPGRARRDGRRAPGRHRAADPRADLQHLRQPQADRDRHQPDVEAEAGGRDDAREL